MSGIIYYENVDICYNGSPVIKKVSFSAEKGEILGIAGESGSGKSTLIKAAIGLLGKNGSVTGGKIWYEEKNLLDLNAKELRKICGNEIGMIFQNAGSSFCPIRTVGEQLLEEMKEHRKIKKAEFEDEAAEMLAKFGFQDPKRILKSYPFELSGGMQQRVGFGTGCFDSETGRRADENDPRTVWDNDPYRYAQHRSDPCDGGLHAGSERWKNGRIRKDAGGTESSAVGLYKAITCSDSCSSEVKYGAIITDFASD